jgi:hypothetical protein
MNVWEAQQQLNGLSDQLGLIGAIAVFVITVWATIAVLKEANDERKR